MSRVLIVGSGGREAALAWKLQQSVFVEKLFCAPGNAGIEQHAECRAVQADDLDGLLELARQERIDFTVVGPEVPLIKGIHEVFMDGGKTIFGPSMQAALYTEGSKADCKILLEALGVPIPRFDVFAIPRKAKMYIRKEGLPIVIKADGLAGGKGVTVAQSLQEAREAIDRLLTSPEDKIVIEEYLEGKECSFIVLTDGEHIIPLPAARDYKQVSPGGPNTGGMGCIAPIPEMTPKLEQRILQEIIMPILKGLRALGHPFRGSLYAGLMLTPGGPKVLELNCRLGDPETQVILVRSGTEILPLFHATTNGTCSYRFPEWRNQAAVCVVLASQGYPGTPEVGFPISGLEEAQQKEDVLIFHAGTRLREDGTFLTAGGRVLNVVGQGKNLAQARERAYDAVRCISFEGMWYRDDIGL